MCRVIVKLFVQPPTKIIPLKTKQNYMLLIKIQEYSIVIHFNPLAISYNSISQNLSNYCQKSTVCQKNWLARRPWENRTVFREFRESKLWYIFAPDWIRMWSFSHTSSSEHWLACQKGASLNSRPLMKYKSGAPLTLT